MDGKTKKHSSWPNENINEHVSKGFAALKALEEFQKEEELLKTMRRSTDESVICDRIYAVSILGLRSIESHISMSLQTPENYHKF